MGRSVVWTDLELWSAPGQSPSRDITPPNDCHFQQITALAREAPIKIRFHEHGRPKTSQEEEAPENENK